MSYYYWKATPSRYFTREHRGPMGLHKADKCVTALSARELADSQLAPNSGDDITRD